MQEPPRYCWAAKLTWPALLASALLLSSIVAWMRYSGHVWPSPPPSVEAAPKEFMEVAEIASGQPSWQIVSKERDLCSKTKDNCMSSKCCKVSGYHCFGINDTVAQCMKYCTPQNGKACTALSRPLVLVP